MMQRLVVLLDQLLEGKRRLGPDDCLEEGVDEFSWALESGRQVDQFCWVVVEAVVNSESDLEPRPLLSFSILEQVMAQIPERAWRDVADVLGQQSSDFL